MKIVLTLLLLLSVLVIDRASAQCAQALTTQNVCLYGTTSLSGAGGNMAQENCQLVNNNPFSYPNSGTNCEAAIRSDGSACVEFYAKYMCSSICPKCNLSPCNYYCDNYQSLCPTAAANNCFRGIFCENVAPPACVDWDVDTSKIPSAPVTTTRTTTTTQRPATTTTHQGTGTQAPTTTTPDDLTSNAGIIKVLNTEAVMVIAFGIAMYLIGKSS